MDLPTATHVDKHEMDKGHNNHGFRYDASHSLSCSAKPVIDSEPRFALNNLPPVVITVDEVAAHTPSVISPATGNLHNPIEALDSESGLSGSNLDRGVQAVSTHSDHECPVEISIAPTVHDSKLQKGATERRVFSSSLISEATISASRQKALTSVVTDMGDSLFLKRATDSIKSLNSRTSSENSELESTSLRKKLWDAMEKSHDHDRKFITKAQLSALMQPDVIDDEIAKFENSLRHRLKNLTMRPSSNHDAKQQGQTKGWKICGASIDDPLRPPTYIYNQGCPGQLVNSWHPTRKKTFIKIFAILLLIQEKKDKLQPFLDEDVSDLDLPLTIVKDDNGKPAKPLELRCRKDLKVPLNCFKGWKSKDIEKFENQQWAVLTPYFGYNPENPAKILRYVLDTKIILPFTKFKSMRRRGAEGDLFLAAVHSDSHGFKEYGIRETHNQDGNWKGSQSDLFAVKRVPLDNRVRVQKEAKILELLNQRPHPHLIKLLVTYEYREYYYLMFPLAEGNLLELWESGDRNQTHLDETTIQWFAEQCEGVASGLKEVHRVLTVDSNSFERAAALRRESLALLQSSRLPPAKDGEPVPKALFCTHGDIKPQNILVFRDPRGETIGGKGFLKIADFGVAKYSYHGAVAQKPFALTPAYNAPESSERLVRAGKSAMTASYDIWSLGCLYLDFTTWCLGGWKAIWNFESKRKSRDPDFGERRETATFYTLEGYDSNDPEPKVKECVGTFVGELHRNPACTEFFHDFLEMIQEKMLVVDNKGRMTSGDIEGSIDEMRKVAKNHPKYFSAPAPWA